MSVKTEKPVADRVKECITILKKITDELHISEENPTIRVFKKRMAQYWRDGKAQDEKIPLIGYNRIILYKFPKWSHQEVEVTLRVHNIQHPHLPPDLEEELQGPARTAAAVMYQSASAAAATHPPSSTASVSATHPPSSTASVSVTHPPPPPDPSATGADQTNNATQSDPAHPSPPS
jgi:hypothetical protein